MIFISITDFPCKSKGKSENYLKFEHSPQIGVKAETREKTVIYITGDIHGDKNRFSDVKKAGIRKGDTLLVCGDFGFVWDGSDTEKRLLKWIGKRRYHVLFVDGCNENHALLKQYTEVLYKGGKARQISGNLYLLSRGEIFDIDEKKVFAFGGGDSSEKYAAFEEETLLLPSEEELQRARENLNKCGNRVDIVVTHDAPAKVRQFIDMENLDELTHLHAFFEEVVKNVRFDGWYFGKYHANRLIPPRYHMLFTTVAKIK